MDKNNQQHNTGENAFCAVIFDLDGTLLYTLDNLHESVNYALNAYNLPPRTLKEIRSFVGNGVKKLMERAVYAAKKPEEPAADPSLNTEAYSGQNNNPSLDAASHFEENNDPLSNIELCRTQFIESGNPVGCNLLHHSDENLTQDDNPSLNIELCGTQFIEPGNPAGCNLSHHSDENLTQDDNPSSYAELSKYDFEACLALFKEHYAKTMHTKTRPYDGIEELLRELGRHGVKCAVVSNKFDAAVKELCDRYFDGLLCAAIGEGESVRKKPAPDGVFKALAEIDSYTKENITKSVSPALPKKRLSIASEKESEPSEKNTSFYSALPFLDGSSAAEIQALQGVVYVGDSEVDIETAANAGLPCISVSWGYKDEDFLLAHGAKTVAHTPQELMQILLRQD